MISALIAFRERENNNNIDYCIRYLSKCKYLSEIIIVNQNTKEFDRIEIVKNPLVRVLHNNYDGPFAKSWAYNIAIKNARSEFLSFIDADCIMSPLYFEQALKTLIKDKNSYTLHGFIYTENVSQAESMPYSIALIRPECQGHITTHKDNVFKIQGFNERIRHWGFEDNDFVNRLDSSRILRRNGLSKDEVVYHLPHKISDHSYNIKNQAHVVNDFETREVWGSEDHIPQFYI